MTKKKELQSYKKLSTNYHITVSKYKAKDYVYLVKWLVVWVPKMNTFTDLYDLTVRGLCAKMNYMNEICFFLIYFLLIKAETE